MWPEYDFQIVNNILENQILNKYSIKQVFIGLIIKQIVLCDFVGW